MPKEMEWDELKVYLSRPWSRFWNKIRELEPEERYEQLDNLTLQKTDGLKLEVRCARWYYRMSEMYRQNDDLEF